MSYQVELNEIVNYEINSALEYIEYTLFAPMAAQKLWNKIEEKKKFLAKNPYMYSVVPNKRLAKFGIRFVMIGNYLLF